MHIKEYIQAAHETITDGVALDVVLKNLQESLKRRGLSKIYPRVLKGLIEKLERAEASTTPKVVVARAGDTERYASAIATAVAQIAPQTTYDTYVDETIIGGFIVTGKGKRIDHSYKSTLLDTYHRLVD
jgi:F0F1-type ATP synthase delta subunit